MSLLPRTVVYSPSPPAIVLLTIAELLLILSSIFSPRIAFFISCFAVSSVSFIFLSSASYCALSSALYCASRSSARLSASSLIPTALSIASFVAAIALELFLLVLPLPLPLLVVEVPINARCTLCTVEVLLEKTLPSVYSLVPRLNLLPKVKLKLSGLSYSKETSCTNGFRTWSSIYITFIIEPSVNPSPSNPNCSTHSLYSGKNKKLFDVISKLNAG